MDYFKKHVAELWRNNVIRQIGVLRAEDVVVTWVETVVVVKIGQLVGCGLDFP